MPLDIAGNDACVWRSNRAESCSVHGRGLLWQFLEKRYVWFCKSLVHGQNKNCYKICWHMPQISALDLGRRIMFTHSNACSKQAQFLELQDLARWSSDKGVQLYVTEPIKCEPYFHGILRLVHMALIFSWSLLYCTNHRNWRIFIHVGCRSSRVLLFYAE